MQPKITVRFTHNQGQGFDQDVIVADGATIRDLIATHYGHLDPSAFTVSKNRTPVSDLGTRLYQGDRVSVTPKKVDAGV